jgi:hypothetical protein
VSAAGLDRTLVAFADGPPLEDADALRGGEHM